MNALHDYCSWLGMPDAEFHLARICPRVALHIIARMIPLICLTRATIDPGRIIVRWHSLQLPCIRQHFVSLVASNDVGTPLIFPQLSKRLVLSAQLTPQYLSACSSAPPTEPMQPQREDTTKLCRLNRCKGEINRTSLLLGFDFYPDCSKTSKKMEADADVIAVQEEQKKHPWTMM